jgi:hypothetical protein
MGAFPKLASIASRVTFGLMRTLKTASVGAAAVGGMMPGDVDLACSCVRDVQPQGTAPQIVGREPSCAGRGPERFGADGFQFVVGYRSGGGRDVDGLALAGGRGGVEDHEFSLGAFCQVARVLRLDDGTAESTSRFLSCIGSPPEALFVSPVMTSRNAK